VLADEGEIAELAAGAHRGLLRRLASRAAVGLGHAEVAFELLVEVVFPSTPASRPEPEEVHAAATATM
jgi:hypothetical protein